MSGLLKEHTKYNHRKEYGRSLRFRDDIFQGISEGGKAMGL